MLAPSGTVSHDLIFDYGRTMLLHTGGDVVQTDIKRVGFAFRNIVEVLVSWLSNMF